MFTREQIERHAEMVEDKRSDSTAEESFRQTLRTLALAVSTNQLATYDQCTDELIGRYMACRRLMQRARKATNGAIRHAESVARVAEHKAFRDNVPFAESVSIALKKLADDARSTMGGPA